MQILIVNTFARGGGAASASRHLAEALATTYPQHKVVYLTLRDERFDGKESLFKSLPNLQHAVADDNLLRRAKAVTAKYIERGEIFCRNGFHRRKLFEISTSLYGLELSKHLLFASSDIIHLHYINFGLISLSDLRRLPQCGKPILWTLHDMWPITAVSPHLDDPNVYRSPWEGKENRWVDRIAKEKKRTLDALDPYFVPCSHWLGKKVAKSQFVKRPIKCEVIPNGIDVELFRPILNKPTNEKRILIGSANNADRRKGLKELIATMHALKESGMIERHNITFDLIGNCNEEVQELMEPFPVEYHGFIDDEKELAQLYSRSYLLLFPSLFENLPCTIMESMSCGTPVVAFDVGGIPEMIRSKVTGYMAPRGDVASLSEGVKWMLNLTAHEYAAVSMEAREFVVNSYSYDAIAKAHLALYNKLIQQ